MCSTGITVTVEAHTLTHRVGSTRAKLESTIIEDFPTKDTPKTGILCLVNPQNWQYKM